MGLTCSMSGLNHSRKQSEKEDGSPSQSPSPQLSHHGWANQSRRQQFSGLCLVGGSMSVQTFCWETKNLVQSSSTVWKQDKLNKSMALPSKHWVKSVWYIVVPVINRLFPQRDFDIWVTLKKRKGALLFHFTKKEFNKLKNWNSKLVMRFSQMLNEKVLCHCCLWVAGRWLEPHRFWPHTPERHCRAALWTVVAEGAPLGHLAMGTP